VVREAPRRARRRTQIPAAEGNALRGWEFHLFVLDEFASVRDPDDVMAGLKPCMRLRESRILIGTTPRPAAAIIATLIRAGVMPGPDGGFAVPDPRLRLVPRSSHDNRELPPEFKRNLIDPWEGSEIGQREIYGKVILEVPGALFRQKRIDALRCEFPDRSDIREIVVAIDPSLTSKKTSDEVGMLLMCSDKAREPRSYVLADNSGIKGPEQWAREAYDLYFGYGCIAIVYETASLRDLVEPLFRSVLRPGEPMLRLVPAEAHDVNKYGRAAAVSLLVNTDPPRCYFCGVFPGLEVEMTGYTGTSRKSP
jgi:phage terminase large subunit-like protein